MNVVEKKDWDEIIELSIEYAFAESLKSQEEIRNILIEKLSSLQNIYGDNVNIIATIAEYTTDIDKRKSLLHKAYEIATINDDTKNKVMIASSLADVYFELKDEPHFLEWLSRLKFLLKIYPDSAETMNFKFLNEEWNNYKNS